MSEDKTPRQTAAENWARYRYGISRGHREYTETAKMLEGMYLGGGYDRDGNLLPGGHWSEADLEVLSEQGRPAYEFNQIKPAIDAALGYQIANRMDISFRPRSGDANKQVAEVRSKVAMQIADNNKLHWLETEVFGDGMIQQRGFFDCRISFDDSTEGEILITTEDPMDVIPDPDAKSYDPKTWGDVVVTRFLTLDQIEGLYGLKARKEAEDKAGSSMSSEAFGDGDDEGEMRNTFGTQDRFDSEYTDGGVKRLRIIDRQHYIRTRMEVSISPDGDVRPMTGDETPEARVEMQANGFLFTRRMVNRVRWTVSTCDTLLHDDWSPYDRLTIIPFFPYFRRGKTRGMVDNAVGPSKALDKGVSQAVHIINTTANSGYQMEQDQLVNMSSSDLAVWGSKTGLVLERKKGTPPLAKITANEMPRGVAEIIGMATQTIQDVTVPDAMRGNLGEGESGIAIQSRQHASQQILAVPLDSLARTRHMLAEWINYGISKYYTTRRVFRITKSDPATGKEVEDEIVINELDEASGLYLNDMTAGEYDVVITDQPMQVTFENSQFTQVMEMRKEGVAIPDTVVIKHSNLSDKHEVITMMEGQGQAPADPTIEAKVGLIVAQTEKTRAEAVNKSVEGLYSATRAAGQVALNPQLVPVADQMLKSAGFEDKDAAPIIPGIEGGMAPVEMEQNTNPLTPTNPGVGINAGIETPDIMQGAGQ